LDSVAAAVEQCVGASIIRMKLLFDENCLLLRVLCNLRAGDVAKLVDFVPHPSDGEEGCVLEVFNAIGESFAVVAVPSSAVEVLRPDEILTVRPLAKTSLSTAQSK
jgi:hypothetical protein